MVNTKPVIIPEIAPSLLILVEKIPIIITGKKDAAAKPKANATTWATKPGGFTPKYPARSTAPVAAILAILNSFLSDIFGLKVLNRSLETDVEITKSNPAAVESAAAIAPAATRPTTQFGSLAISGLANTMISRSIVNSFAFGSATYWTFPSPFLSSTFIRSVFSQVEIHWGSSDMFFSEVVSTAL